MSSRVIVKNLPPYLTQQQLLDHFKASFAVTDCKLVTTHDGKSRKFGFVGFKTTKDATDAIKYFDKTYLHTCRITVDEALAIGSNQLTRPWSKYSEGSSGFQKTHPKEIADNDKKAQFLKDAVGLDENDQKLKEYLQVMKPHGASTKTWGNDDVIDAGHHLKLPQILNDNDKGLYQELPSEDIIEKAAKEDSSKQSALDTNISDMDYLRSKMKKAENDADIDVINVHPSRLAILDESGAFNSDYNNLQNSLNKADVEVVEAESYRENENEEISADIIADTGRIMARNLAYSCTQEDLEELFKPFGLIVEIHIPISRETKNSKGYGFILYVMPENALKAFETLDKTIFQGRILEIVPAKVKPKSRDETMQGPHSFKSKRDQERKSNSSNEFNWNTLFMNSDAVADSMATKLGVQKSDILDNETDNMAVRLALAETNIINDTKKYLEEAGVCLNSFIKRKVRSKILILVKNLPSKTVEEDITTLFEKFGELGRVVFPPSRTIALVEFTEPNEAKAAFKKLAFSKFKNSVLYLEWAPIGTFTTEYNKEEAEKIKIAKNNVELVVNKAEPETKKINLLEIDENEPVSTVFVKNLNFETTDSTLKSTFESLSGLRSARISRKMDAKSKTKLSMGFGFLEFTTKEEAMTCIKTMQNFKLDNHELVLKFSNSTQNESKSRKRVEEDIIITGTKLIVRNLPFEATKKDLQQLFTSFGQVKSVRLPSKFDGKHRGFGFVDFLTVNEAKSAFESLGATHLYGRHLVIEWAQDENSIDAMREKTQKNFVKSSNKKQRVEMGDEDDHFLQD